MAVILFVSHWLNARADGNPETRVFPGAERRGSVPLERFDMHSLFFYSFLPVTMLAAQMHNSLYYKIIIAFNCIINSERKTLYKTPSNSNLYGLPGLRV